MKHKSIFTADLHGYEEQYKSLFKTALKENAQSIIIGGDLAAKNGINPLEQELFLGETLPSIVKDFKDKSDAQIYLILGNDDVTTNLDLLEKYNGVLWNHIHGRRFSITPDYEIVGYPYIPITPFLFKDFEKFDIKPKKEKRGLLNKIFGGDNLVQFGAKLEGEVWIKDGFVKKVFDSKNMGATIEDDLNSSIFSEKPEKTIYVFHCPPHNTFLDVTPSLMHVGSKAIRNFIEKNQPYLTLFGHIHDIVETTGKYNSRIDNSLIMTAGNGEDPSFLSYLSFDLYDVQNTKERKTIKIDNFCL